MPKHLHFCKNCRNFALRKPLSNNCFRLSTFDFRLLTFDYNMNYKRILSWLLIIAAYGFLAYKIVTYDNYAALAAQFRQAEWWQYLCLALCFMLFPANRFFESWKWQYLLRKIEPMNLWEAQRQVYYGTIAGFVTPYKLGEYPGRALLLRNTESLWLTATCLGLIGGYAMTAVVVIMGLPAAMQRLSPDGSLLLNLILSLLGAILVIVGLPALMRRLDRRSWKKERTALLIHSLAELTIADGLVMMGISFLRYLCFLFQLWLCLRFCGVQLDPTSTLITLPLYWMMITITPNIPLAEIAVRGAWAAVIFEPFGEDLTAAAVIATMLLWTINTLPPLLIGSIIGSRKAITPRE